ncbi:unnamed protein product [Withania somnifera]
MEKAFPFFLFIGLLSIHYVMDSSAMTPTNTTTDQLTLLSLKSQIVSDPSHLLNESWTPANFVCHWVGVTCGSRHQRVKSLNLSGMALTGRIPRDFGNLTFLVSLDLASNNFQGILPQEMTRLRRLKFLDLSINNFSGEVPSWFGFLHQLQFLNLGNNSFTGSIPSSFSNISTLETLNLKFNSIEGEIPKVIGSLISLRELYLRGNKLTGFIPLSISNASRLEALDISFNSVQGNIPEGLGNLHNMNLLSIQVNQLKGSIPFTIFNISRIETIAFTDNSLSGDLPNGLCNGLPILKGLYLSNNKLHGPMPTSLSNCSQLQILSLSENEFGGSIHSKIGKLSNLQILYLGSNHFTGSLPISIFNISSLQLLSLWRNNLIGFLPREIGNLTKMQHLDLRENRFTGEIPKEIRNLIELELLNLHDNTFSGPLDIQIFNISGLRAIDLSNNNLSGTLPPNVGSILPNIEELYLSSLTNLVGIIPHSISNCSKLTILELSNNKLTGMISNSLGYLTRLQELKLGGNNLTSDSSLSFLTSLTNCRNLTSLYLELNPLNGMLPASTGNLSTSLLKFSAGNCKIKGRIPNEVGNLSSLLFFDLARNNLVGSIPSSIGDMRNLQRLQLYDNKLIGFIGNNICKLQHLGDIYLGENQLSGSLPYCLGNVTSLREIHLNSNKLSSNIPASIGNLKDLIVLDLSSNNMVGSLPPEIGNMKAATLIDLSVNQFSNTIPREIGGLQTLQNLSLRHNKLQGSIPDSMSNMKLQNLKYFNVSVNKLYGEIPSEGPFKNLSGQFFIYNEALCGSSRFSIPPCTTSSKHISNRKRLLVLFLLLGLALCFVPITFLSIWIRYRRGQRAPQQADSLSTVTRDRISYYELLQATDELSESNLIGSGSFGSVYKGVLLSGTAIAVKVFNLQLEAAFKSFDTECEVLRSLRHRNLVKVITSCSNLDFKAVVLEYMPNGSLEKYLYSHNYFLDISQRLSIMIDVACALEYLHHGCSLPVIHCDIKPSNVLMDENMVAHLSDFGISKLLGEDESDLYTKTLATLGYIAPEYGLDGLVSTKCDVYSYGIMLLETFTRRKPNEFEGDLSLKQWVSYSLPEAIVDVVDANLVTPIDNRLQKELDVVASIMKVALDCCAESPARRTNMKDVVGMLQKIEIQLLAR